MRYQLGTTDAEGEFTPDRLIGSISRRISGDDFADLLSQPPGLSRVPSTAEEVLGSLEDKIYSHLDTRGWLQSRTEI